jgi:hypothetical protein
MTYRFKPGGQSSAFSVPHRICSGSGPSSPRPPPNPLATGRLLSRLHSLYSEINEKRPPTKEPLPAVIGLELVVDYVKHEKEPK